MAINTTEIADFLRSGGLGDYVEKILPFAKSCIRLHASLAENPADLPLGSSRIGGLPDLPPNMKWPMRNGRPCEFIAQINLSDAAPFDVERLLPQQGLLFFFFDGLFYEDTEPVGHQFGSEIILYYSGDFAVLERVPNFPEALDEFQHHPMCSLTYRSDWMLPTYGSVAAHKLEKEVFNFNHQNSNDVPHLVKTYRQLAETSVPHEDHEKHHLLGHPEPVIQDDALYTASMVQNNGITEGYAVSGDLMLLLQISSDDLPEMMWGDTSSLYYCISKQDLLAKQFDKIICVHESH
ncbi:MAG: DUF1963 domain-containing protein [Chloroflexi bacterium]|nr:DUF1963 domain-containing protein [Chloroflexota bacterium]MCC6895865.1 DUF1963 domain-containing protein [Anaerolineae bacterium]